MQNKVSTSEGISLKNIQNIIGKINGMPNSYDLILLNSKNYDILKKNIIIDNNCLIDFIVSDIFEDNQIIATSKQYFNDI